MKDQHELDVACMRRAVRIALLGHGLAEPNPLVGCVITDPEGHVIATGHHARHGGPHAEVIALERAGSVARGGTLYVTLEPCRHHGRTPPCTDAIITAGISRVVYGTADPFEPAGGGAAVLAEAGIMIEFLELPQVERLNRPWVTRVTKGRPWVIAKSAMTLDGRIATSTGQSKWISSETSRRLVHRERGRVDVILTGIGTVLKDDPELTARQGTPRRLAMRVLYDPDLLIPDTAKIIQTARDVPTLIATNAVTLADRSGHAERLREHGIVFMELTADSEDKRLEMMLRTLHKEHDVANVLLEAGGGLSGKLLRAGLIDQLWLFLGPCILGDQQAPGPMRGLSPGWIKESTRLELLSARTREQDVVLDYLVDQGD